jgi:hypothetical protein
MFNESLYLFEQVLYYDCRLSGRGAFEQKLEAIYKRLLLIQEALFK